MSRTDVLLAVLLLAIVATLVILVIMALATTGPWGCDARWDGPTDWGIQTGCRVLTEQGFVPEGNVRVLD